MAKRTPLLYTTKARHRILGAISWDVRAKKTTIMDHLRGTNQQHDLDLSCFVFNDDGEYIDYVSSMAQDSMDSTGSIYHSGDDNTGEGGGDDEAISIELAGLPDDTKTLIFLTEIRSEHTFKDVDGINFRIADGMTNQNLYELNIADGKEADKQACIIAKVYRDFGSLTGWSYAPIEQYPDLAEVTDWGSYLERYL
jgi:stress response protein SCP2